MLLMSALIMVDFNMLPPSSGDAGDVLPFLGRECQDAFLSGPSLLVDGGKTADAPTHAFCCS